MRSVYLDNGATSYPKAPGVGEAMSDFITNIGCNIARGGYQQAYDAAGRVLEVREKLNALVNGPGPRNVVFTSGAGSSSDGVFASAESSDCADTFSVPSVVFFLVSLFSPAVLVCCAVVVASGAGVSASMETLLQMTRTMQRMKAINFLLILLFIAASSYIFFFYD